MTSPNLNKKYIVQLRGTNASGKSTAMRQYCALNGLKPTWLDIFPRKTKIMSNGQIAVLGWYKPFSNAEGCDAALDNKEHLMTALECLCRDGYEEICFEGMIYSNTYLLPMRINKLAAKYGYSFIACFLSCPYTTELQRLMERNGGKQIDFEAFDKRYFQSRKSFGKLIQSKVLCYEAKTSNIPHDEMGSVIGTAIRGCV